MNDAQNPSTRTWQRPELRRVTTKSTAGGGGELVDLGETGSLPIA